jgi:hypothetical protein
MESRSENRYREVMRKLLIACLATASVAACGGSSKTKTADAAKGSDSGSAGSDGQLSPTTVTVTIGDIPTANANNYIAMFQDGNGAWQVAPAPDAGVYTMTIDSATWSFAFACAATTPLTSGEVEIYSFSVQERTSFSSAPPAFCRTTTAPVTNTVAGTITGIPVTGAETTGTFKVYFDGLELDVPAVATGTATFTLDTVPEAKHDLFVVHMPPVAVVGGPDNADMVYRKVTDETTGSAMAIDWTTAIATQVVAGAGSPTTTELFGAGTDPILATASTSGVFLGSSSQTANDIYEQVASFVGGADFSESWLGNTVTGPDLNEPATLGGIQSSETATTPYPILSTDWAVYANAAGYQLVATEPDGTGATAGTLTWFVVMSPGYVGSSPKFVMPDFSAITGWTAATQFTAGMVSVNVEPLTSSAGVMDIPFVNPAAVGTTRGRTIASATVTLP